MLATPNNREIVFQDVPNQIIPSLREVFERLREKHGNFERDVICTAYQSGYSARAAIGGKLHSFNFELAGDFEGKLSALFS